MSEAAHKIRLISEVQNPITKDKDGDGGDGSSVMQYVIDVALNGFCLTVSMDDGTEYKEIHDDLDSVLKSMKGYL